MLLCLEDKEFGDVARLIGRHTGIWAPNDTIFNHSYGHDTRLTAFLSCTYQSEETAAAPRQDQDRSMLDNRKFSFKNHQSSFSKMALLCATERASVYIKKAIHQ